MIQPLTSDYLDLFLRDVPLLDVRAPVEFAQGAFPNADNLPLLTDTERHEVGLRYNDEGQPAAIELYTLSLHDALPIYRKSVV